MNWNYFRLLIWVLMGFGCSGVYAAVSFPQLKVVPWNGHKAATSLTFDDGDPIHLDVAIPDLNRRKLHGTFFLIANKLTRKDDWHQAVKSGQEIGNESLDHLHGDTLSPQEDRAQVVGAEHVLQNEFGIPIYSFAYPYSETPPALKYWVEKTCFVARGGSPDLVSPDSESIDWFDLPSKTTMTNYPFSTYQSWIDEDLQYGDWLIWMIHGIQGTPWGWQPITLKTFNQILDDLQSKDIWIGTFTQIGSYLRAWKSFEASTVQINGQEEIYTWIVPNHCPMNVKLKVAFPSPSSVFEIWQNGERVIPDAKGDYTILFNLGHLRLKAQG